MSALVDASAAITAWELFLDAYSKVEPGAAFDFRGDPPPFIFKLRQRARDAMPARPGR